MTLAITYKERNVYDSTYSDIIENVVKIEFNDPMGFLRIERNNGNMYFIPIENIAIVRSYPEED